MSDDFLRAAKASLDDINDEEIRAVVALAAGSGIRIMPSGFAPRPVLIVPSAMYERLRKLLPEEQRA